ncbi:Redox-sensing transcriptional repressor Rex [compost metagenome]
MDSGIEAILNFAPVILKTPANIRIHAADFTTDLQSLAYYLHDGKDEAEDEQQ